MADRHSCHSAHGGVRGSSASSALEQKLQFSLSLHQVAAAPQDAHNNKRITPRSARARTLNNTFREFPLFIRAHIPEGFLLFALKRLSCSFFPYHLELFDTAALIHNRIIHGPLLFKKTVYMPSFYKRPKSRCL